FVCFFFARNQFGIKRKKNTAKQLADHGNNHVNDGIGNKIIAQYIVSQPFANDQVIHLDGDKSTNRNEEKLFTLVKNFFYMLPFWEVWFHRNAKKPVAHPYFNGFGSKQCQHHSQYALIQIGQSHHNTEK